MNPWLTLKMNRWLTLKRRKSRRNLRKSSRKRQKTTTLDVGVDRLSALPDPILGIILSFLPVTKEAIATSILSKRWRFMWKTVHNLAFFHWGQKEGDDTKFVEFVNRVLLLHDARLLHKFMLFWKPRCDSVHLRSWIETAITRNVRRLNLDVETRVGPDSFPEPVEMPISVFNSEWLRHLVLDMGIYLSEADVIFLPRLERLELINVDFESDWVFKNLVSGCPVLNFLNLQVDIKYMIDYFGRGSDDDDDYDYGCTYMIYSTSLKRIEACFSNNSEGAGEDSFSCSLTLATPSLEVLVLEGSLLQMKFLRSLSCLVEVFLGIELSDVNFDDPNAIVEVVRAFDCAKYVTLSNDITWGLSLSQIRLSTEFKRLVKLDMEISCCHCCIPLRDFIQYSDNLEVLTISQIRRGDYHDHHTDWNAPVEVPSWLTNSLKKVVFDVYSGTADEREVLRYMLKHGSVLEVMQIKCARDTANFELLQEICKFPRKSRACEVEFIIDDESIPDRVVRRNPNPLSENQFMQQVWLGCNATAEAYI